MESEETVSSGGQAVRGNLESGPLYMADVENGMDEEKK